MVHIDVKKVGRIPDGGGWRAHGRGSDGAKFAERSKRKTQRGGYVYLHSAIDGYSRLAYTEALSDEKAVTAIAFVHRARAWFAAHGIAHIERIITDNGACYRAGAFARALLGSRHQRITPYTPRHNGKVERYNRIISEDFLYARTWTSEDQRPEALGAWNIHYNYHRPHSATDGKPPASRLQAAVSNVLASYRSEEHTWSFSRIAITSRCTLSTCPACSPSTSRPPRSPISGSHCAAAGRSAAGRATRCALPLRSCSTKPR